MISHEKVGAAKIKVIGVGGGGCNAITRMYKERLVGVDYLGLNTDAQSLLGLDIPSSIRIGEKLTKGQGVGGDPVKGTASAEESEAEIQQHLLGADMIFVAAGMGGGTGTGAAPIVAKIAKESGALVVGVVTKPFEFEGARRAKVADEGINELRKHCDTLLAIPNERLNIICEEEITTENAFRMADDVLRIGVQSIAEVVTTRGEINTDFADVNAIMRDAGPAWMSIGYGAGEDRAIDAVKQALSNPLLDMTIDGATGVLFNIVGGSDLKLSELEIAAQEINKLAHPTVNMIFGMGTDEKMNSEIRVTIIATGFDTPGSLMDTEESYRGYLHEVENEEVAGEFSPLDLPPFLRKYTRANSG